MSSMLDVSLLISEVRALISSNGFPPPSPPLFLFSADPPVTVEIMRDSLDVRENMDV